MDVKKRDDNYALKKEGKSAGADRRRRQHPQSCSFFLQIRDRPEPDQRFLRGQLPCRCFPGNLVDRIHHRQVCAFVVYPADTGFQPPLFSPVADEQPAGHGKAFNLLQAESLAHPANGFLCPEGFPAVFHDQLRRQLQRFHLLDGHRVFSWIAHSGLSPLHYASCSW